MPKLPPDEKLFTPEQLRELNETCERCCKPLGQHRAQGRNCPLSGSTTGFEEGSTFRRAGSTNFVPEPLTTVGATPAFNVGKKVQINPDRTESIGTIVEVVSPNTLPTTKGLRHIADKRRLPKSRGYPSYVVQIGDKPTRANLYWPTSVSAV
jgi:hypothetical protein